MTIPPNPMDRFRSEYRETSQDEQELIIDIKVAAENFASLIDNSMLDGREKSLAFTHLEDCVMRAVRGITE